MSRRAASSQWLPVAVVLLSLTTACATYPIPQQRNVTAKTVAFHRFGSWTTLETSRGEISGELIAVGRTKIFLATTSRPTNVRHLTAVDRSSVTGVVVYRYVPDSGGPGAWTALGTLSTLSHGFFLIISAPLWALVGGIATGSYARSGRETFEMKVGSANRDNWAGVSEFARFPFGLPDRWTRDHDGPPGAGQPGDKAAPPAPPPPANPTPPLPQPTVPPQPAPDPLPQPSRPPS